MFTDDATLEVKCTAKSRGQAPWVGLFTRPSCPQAAHYADNALGCARGLSPRPWTTRRAWHAPSKQDEEQRSGSAKSCGTAAELSRYYREAAGAAELGA